MGQRLGDILVKRGVVTHQQLHAALRDQRLTGKPVGQILIDHGVASEGQIAQAIASQLKLPFIELSRVKADPAAVEFVPIEVIKRHVCLPIRVSAHSLLVAMHDPFDLMALEAMTSASGREVKQAVATRADIAGAIARYLATQANSEEALNALEEEVMARARLLDLAQTRCRTLSIISNKGGVGKTHTSINLAFCLAKDRRKVLLIDADFSNADISNKLDLFPKTTLLDYLNDDKRIEQIVTTTRFGFDLIAGKTGHTKLTHLSERHKLRFIQGFTELSENYDIIFIDLGAGLDTQVLDFALATDDMLILTTPQDIIAGYACAKLSFMRYVELETRVSKQILGYEPNTVFQPHIIVNQLAWGDQGEAFFAKIDSTAQANLNSDQGGFEIRCAYLGGVVHDRERIRKAEEMNAPCVVLFPGEPITECYQALAEKLLSPSKEPRPEQRLKNRFRRFAQIIGVRSQLPSFA